MRLWSLHPALLDRAGLLGVWREALLAQAVLRGRTRGYTRHPQLERFRSSPAPLAGVADYLRAVREEGLVRGYSFDGSKIARARGAPAIPVTEGQLELELSHLRRKLLARDPSAAAMLPASRPVTHPLFVRVPGAAEPWERGVAFDER